MISAKSFAFTTLLIISIFLLTSSSPNNTRTLDLFARQSTSGFPSSQVPSNSHCTKQCAVLNNINDCTTDECVCNNNVANEFASCLDCLVGAGTYTVDQAQSLMDEYETDCSEGGLTVKSETIKSGGAGTLTISIMAVIVTAGSMTMLLA